MNRRRQDLQSMNIDSWPSVDTNALAAIERTTFERRRSAIVLYAKGGAARVIEKQTGINSRQLYQLLDRCLKQSDDGTVCGFRGLLKHKRVASFRRTARSAKQSCLRFFPPVHSGVAAFVDNFAITPREAKSTTRMRTKQNSLHAS